jgi:hypothetical protein
MEQQLQRYAFGAAAAGFVLIWATLGLKTALVSAAAALAASNYRRLTGTARGRRQAPTRSRPRRVTHARPLREESHYALPMVPDEPSLIINASEF